MFRSAKRSLTRLVCGLAAVMAGTTAAWAQAEATDYPNRPLRIIVPFAPGGGTDFTARLLSKKLGENLGQPIIVDNRPGAGTNIGAAALVQAEPDGYTLLLSAASTYAINPNLQKSLPYDVFRDFKPVARVATMPLMLVANPSFPANTFDEFLKHAKAQPKGLGVQFGSPGLGSTHQLAMERLAQQAGFESEHVAYKGASHAMQDLISGAFPVMFLDLATGGEQIKAGKLKVIASGSLKPSVVMPGVPTIAESGLPGYEAAAWIGIVAPAGTPDSIVNKLNSELNKVLQDEEVKAAMYRTGTEPVLSTPQEFAQVLRDENTLWADVIRQAGIEKK